jgi:putative transposase
LEGGIFMPRIAREKTPESIYHVMCRSISEVPLYKNDDDKMVYLSLAKKYQNLHHFKVYGYCIMDNHNHFIIDANGADISKIMHDINFSYARYYNKRHKRHGHLFQDRFKSKQVCKDEYLYALSAYIHNNALDIPGYEGCPENYQFSSLGIYLGLRRDSFEIVSLGFVLGMLSGDAKKARKKYMDLVFACNTEERVREYEFEDEGTEYRSGKKILVRDVEPEKIVDFIAEKMNTSDFEIKAKHTRKNIDSRAILVVLLRCLCNFKCTDICHLLGNITQSGVSKLSSRGIGLISEGEKYRHIVKEFLEEYAA